MNQNISKIDRIIRILIAVVIAILFFTNQIAGTLAIVLWVVAGAMLVTSVINFCPIYYFLGISSKKKEK